MNEDYEKASMPDLKAEQIWVKISCEVSGTPREQRRVIEALVNAANSAEVYELCEDGAAFISCADWNNHREALLEASARHPRVILKLLQESGEGSDTRQYYYQAGREYPASLEVRRDLSFAEACVWSTAGNCHLTEQIANQLEERLKQAPGIAVPALDPDLGKNWTDRLLCDVLEKERRDFEEYLQQGGLPQDHLFYVAAMACFEAGHSVGFNDICSNPGELDEQISRFLEPENQSIEGESP